LHQKDGDGFSEVFKAAIGLFIRRLSVLSQDLISQSRDCENMKRSCCGNLKGIFIDTP
jgi:hypothetical protein